MRQRGSTRCSVHSPPHPATVLDPRRSGEYRRPSWLDSRPNGTHRHRRSRTPPYTDVAKRFATRVGWIADDLETRGEHPEAVVLHGDSGDPTSWSSPQRASLTEKGTVALTSPPYLNNFDYADATRLEMFFWGRNATWREMVEDVRSEMLTATTQQTSVLDTETSLSSLANWPTTYSRVQRLTAALERERLHRRAGKAYDRVLPSYMTGILSVLTQLKANLEPGSWTGWVVGDSAPYGVYIDTPELIRGAAHELGYDGDDSVRLRERGLRWRTNGTRHQVSLDERLIWIRTPTE
jgi:hypothetical protein